MKFRLEDYMLSRISRILMKEPPLRRAEILMHMIQSAVLDEEPAAALRFLLELDNRLYELLGNQSILYGNGLHTKHRHIGYHDFFIENISPGERVLDIGSGNGLLSFKMANQVSGVTVVGIELNEKNVAIARERYCHPNVSFIHGDAEKDLPDGNFDVVTMSNVLEHIQKRVELLKNITSKIRPEKIVLRVPVFERDWKVPLKKELDIDYRLDPTHCIEYTLENFQDEMARAGLEVADLNVCWGEIRSVVRPGKQE